ncbi:hypothetical protein RCL1_003790 [Eukaryota sp. TZLM3-RCL]
MYQNTPKTPRKSILSSAPRRSLDPRRSSVAPRPSMGAPRTSTMSRPSLAPPRPSTISRSSMRPSSNTNLRSCWNTVHHYLVEKRVNFNIPLLDGSTAPAESLLYDIVNEIVHEIDKSLVITKETFPKTFSALLKFLRYPTSFSPSSLASPTIPHTWTKILPALSWLVTIITANTPDYADRYIFLDERGEERAFLIKLSGSYIRWLSNDPDHDKELIESLQLTFKEREDQCTQEIRKTRIICEGHRAELDKFKAKGSKLTQAQKAKETLLNDELKLRELVKGFTNKKNDLIKKQSNLIELSEKLNQEWTDFVKKREGLNLVLTSQEQSKNEILALLTTRQKRQDKLTNIKTEADTISRSLWDIEVDLTKNMEKAEVLLTTSKNLLSDSQLDLGINCNLSTNFLENFDESKKSELLEVLSKLESFSSEADVSLKQLVAAELASRDRFKNSKYSIEEKGNSLTLLEQRCENLEQNLSDLKKSIEVTEERDLTDLQEIEQQIRVITVNDVNRTKETLQQQKQNLESEIQKFRSEYEVEKQQLVDLLVSVVNDLIKHKENVENILENAVERCKARTAILFE